MASDKVVSHGIEYHNWSKRDSLKVLRRVGKPRKQKKVMEKLQEPLLLDAFTFQNLMERKIPSSPIHGKAILTKVRDDIRALNTA
ncbi:unnamed protein product [Dovyalis caffra]|uniref:Uncharacterized protein n=1 Tax=Dovyalis caffra TaxID=77055 RepID=A0AAV1S6R3_9ROSI|nr:unnamed protein product [Dovyalis caffra]